MAMQTLIELFIKIFIMIGIGYVLRRREYITAELKQSMNYLVMNVFLPFSMLASGNSEFSSEVSKSLVVTAVFAVGYYLVSMLLSMGLGRMLRLPENHKRIFVMLSCFANVGFLGIPLATALYGSEGALIAVIYNLVYDVIFFTYGIYYVGREGKFELKKLFGNVIAVSAILSVVLYCSPFRLPAVVADTFHMIGSPMVPLSMMVIGCSLAEVNLLGVLKNRYAYLVSSLRLLIFPLAALGTVRMLGIEPVTAAACVMLTAMPAGTMSVIIAEQYDCAPEFAAQAVVQSMVLMIVTLPVMMLLVA